jgi:hypothetical protein
MITLFSLPVILINLGVFELVIPLRSRDMSIRRMIDPSVNLEPRS